MDKAVMPVPMIAMRERDIWYVRNVLMNRVIIMMDLG
jgi:hypothetical protein